MSGINQPGGPFVACPHPSVSGRERELRHLSDGVRRLIRVVNSRDLSREDRARAAARLTPIVEALEARVPEPVPSRLHLGDPVDVPHAGAPYDVIHGLYNPIAPPVTIRYDPPDAVGEVVFDATYEGPPGRVHGAVLIATFDMVFSSANVVAGVSGPTGSLKVQYDEATRTDVPAEFRARQVGRTGRRLHLAGELRQEGVLTCRAEGVFIALERDELHRLSVDDG
ncbi:MAG: hypothetical protein OEW42_03295 [Acidimicrobiia bacterium]|nr:hypothetical protein [Acidimicrobiia bacterium]MDH5237732.1 hypothetical protein [Acidimicrobiia bacterium]